MIDKFFDLLERHKIAFVIGLSIVAFIGMQALIGCVGHNGGSASAEKQETSSQQATDGSGEESGKGGEGSAKEGVKLTEEQKKAVSAYTEADKNLIARLAAAKWSGADGKGTMTFTEDGAYEEVSPGGDAGKTSKKKGTFAVLAISGGTAVPAAGAQDSASDQTTIALLLDDDTVHIAYLSNYSPVAGVPAPGAGTSPALTITCDAFDNTGGYTTAFAWRGLTFEGFDAKEASAAVGGKVDAAEKALTDYIAANMSSSYACSWDRTASYDYESGTATIGAKVTDSITGSDGKEQTHYLTVTYKAADGTFSVADGGAAAQQQQNQEG